MLHRVVRDATVLSVAVLTTALLPCSVGAAPIGTSAPLFSLTALLSIAPDLPALSQSVLVSEVERIWRREGVALKWSAPRGHDRPTAALRILVVGRRDVLATGEQRTWTVGELVPHTGQRALAIASIAGAERVVESSGTRFLLLDRPEFTQYRLGVVLGRAVAHEIGHYLLATPTHADRGLMRAAIDAREFADPSAKTFSLDEPAGQWLRDRLVQIAEGPVSAPGFTYTGPHPLDAQR